MADSNVDITAGSGTSIDTRTEASNGNHRQVIVIGDPSTNAGVAPVDATNGLAVDVKALPASTNTIEVVGDAAEDAAVAGNPVLIGGRYDATPRTLDDGDAGAIALDADGAVHISDGGNSITIDGIVTANLSATDNAVLDSIDSATTAIQTAVEIIDNAISGSEMQVDIVSGNVTNAGTFAVQVDGDALTALQLIDDVVYVDDADWTDGSSKHVLIGGLYQSSPQSITDGDVGPLQVDANGRLIVALSSTDNGVLDNIDTNTTDIPNVIGTDGAAGPSKAISIGGTDGSGNLQEITTDTDGHLQVDVLSGASATEYNEDDATPNPIVGSAILMERDDALSSLTPIEGDWAGLRCSAEGALWTQDFNSDAALTAIQAVQTAVEVIDNAISGSEMQVDVVAALPAGTNAIGKLAANSGVDIGDVDVTSITNDSINGPEAATGPTVDSFTQASINLTTGANQVLASSAANKQIWVYGFGFTVGDADGQTVSFQDEDDTALSGVMEFGQYGGMAVAPSGNFSMPIWKLATNKDLEVDITGGDVDGWISYAVVDVS